MQVCTHASGNTAAIASGKPVRPSTQAIRTSLTPRWCRSLKDGEPELRALGLLPPDAEHLAVAFDGDADRQIAGAGADRAVLAHLDHQRVEVNDRVDGLQRPRAPHRDVLKDGVGDPADRVAADLGAAEIGQVSGDVAYRHASGVKTEDPVIQTDQAR